MDEYVFGANILENLTTGMYKDSKVSYREYIQNACDQIDRAVELGILSSTNEGQIEIWLDQHKRTISIEDNATGIPQADFRRTLANIADSGKKIGTDKGFRGIGRLCGLAYCNELIFTSTALGESVISTMRCKAQLMRELLNRNVNGEKFTASEVLDQIFEFSYAEDKSVESAHWFKVELIEINAENTELLQFYEVKRYLSFIAPVAYQTAFSFSSEIYRHATQIGYKIDEYNILLQGEPIFKEYSTRFKTSKGEDEIFDLEFKDFQDENGNTVMWLWFGLSQFKAVITRDAPGGQMRGLRLRKENIQIGDEDALQKLFQEDRGQHYFVGELFAVSKDLIPNSQRDYFNENPKRLWFEQTLKKYFKEVLYKVYHGGSNINSSFRKIADYEHARTKHEEKTINRTYLDATSEVEAAKQLQEQETRVKDAQKKIEKFKQPSEQTEASSVLARVAKRVEKKQQINALSPDLTEAAQSDPTIKPSLQNKSKTSVYTPVLSQQKYHRTDKLSRCNKNERKLIGKIYSIIMRSTDEATAESIIQKIEEEFK